jgi:hypothetical protein
MSGFQEILVILIILLAIFFIPRMTARKTDQSSASSVIRRPPRHLSARMRLAILVSVVWLLGALFYCRPWEGQWVRFGAIGTLPLVVGWGGYWVFIGYQPPSRQRRPLDRRR